MERRNDFTRSCIDMGMVRKVRCGQKIAFARSGHIWLLKFIFVCHVWLLVQMSVTNARFKWKPSRPLDNKKTKLLLFLSLAVWNKWFGWNISDIKPIWPSGIIPMGLADVFGYVYQVVSMGLWSRPWIILWGRSWRPHWNLLWGIWLQLDGFLGFGHSWALWQTGLVGLAGITGGCLWVHCLCHGCWFLLPLWASVGVHMNMYIWKQLIEYKYGDIAWYTILVLRLSSM